MATLKDYTMDSIEFQQLVKAIRANLYYTVVGLSVQEIQQQNKRLDSDAYAAAIAVDNFFLEKRKAQL